MIESAAPKDWRRSSIFSLARWKNGLAFKSIDFAEAGRPIIKIAELKAGVTSQTARTMADYGPSVSVGFGDMPFSWSGNPDTSIDIFRWDGEDGWLNQHIFKVTPYDGVSGDFLFFLLKWLKPMFAEIARNKQTTGLGHVTIQDLKQTLIGVPDAKEQAEIVGVIGPIQNKIDLNRRMNETLEAMARAIFKDWFVDFGPVRAKMEGREPGLPPRITALFPDRLVDSDMGKIPEGWKIRFLTDLIAVNPVRRLHKGQAAPYLDMANMPIKGHVPDTIAIRSFGSGMRFMSGDTLVARITPCLENGKTAYVDFLLEGEIGWGSTEYIVLRPKPPLPDEFGYCLARSGHFREFATLNMTGTSGRQRVQAQALRQFPLASPTEEIAFAFGNIIRPLIAKAGAAIRESRSLAALRDLLLPKLLSGEVRLRDAEKEVEAVA